MITTQHRFTRSGARVLIRKDRELVEAILAIRQNRAEHGFMLPDAPVALSTYRDGV